MSETIVLDTPSQIQTYRLLTMQRGLILEIDTNMHLTRFSVLSAMTRDGLTNKRTKRAALRDLNGYLISNGLDHMVKWSEKFPTDKPSVWVERDVDGQVWWEPKN